jgi:hypothetical protein
MFDVTADITGIVYVVEWELDVEASVVGAAEPDVGTVVDAAPE